MPPVPSDDSKRIQSSETEGESSGFVYIPTALPSARLFTLDPYANDRRRVEDFIPDLLTDEDPSTG